MDIEKNNPFENDAQDETTPSTFTRNHRKRIRKKKKKKIDSYFSNNTYSSEPIPYDLENQDERDKNIKNKLSFNRKSSSEDVVETSENIFSSISKTTFNGKGKAEDEIINSVSFRNDNNTQTISSSLSENTEKQYIQKKKNRRKKQPKQRQRQKRVVAAYSDNDYFSYDNSNEQTKSYYEDEKTENLPKNKLSYNEKYSDYIESDGENIFKPNENNQVKGQTGLLNTGFTNGTNTKNIKADLLDTADNDIAISSVKTTTVENNVQQNKKLRKLRNRKAISVYSNNNYFNDDNSVKQMQQTFEESSKDDIIKEKKSLSYNEKHFLADSVSDEDIYSRRFDSVLKNGKSKNINADLIVEATLNDFEVASTNDTDLSNKVYGSSNKNLRRLQQQKEYIEKNSKGVPESLNQGFKSKESGAIKEQVEKTSATGFVIDNNNSFTTTKTSFGKTTDMSNDIPVSSNNSKLRKQRQKKVAMEKDTPENEQSYKNDVEIKSDVDNYKGNSKGVPESLNQGFKSKESGAIKEQVEKTSATGFVIDNNNSFTTTKTSFGKTTDMSNDIPVSSNNSKLRKQRQKKVAMEKDTPENEQSYKNDVEIKSDVDNYKGNSKGILENLEQGFKTDNTGTIESLLKVPNSIDSNSINNDETFTKKHQLVNKKMNRQSEDSSSLNNFYSYKYSDKLIEELFKDKKANIDDRFIKKENIGALISHNALQSGNAEIDKVFISSLKKGITDKAFTYNYNSKYLKYLIDDKLLNINSTAKKIDVSNNVLSNIAKRNYIINQIHNNTKSVYHTKRMISSDIIKKSSIRNFFNNKLAKGNSYNNVKQYTKIPLKAASKMGAFLSEQISTNSQEDNNNTFNSVKNISSSLASSALKTATSKLFNTNTSNEKYNLFAKIRKNFSKEANKSTEEAVIDSAVDIGKKAIETTKDIISMFVMPPVAAIKNGKLLGNIVKIAGIVVIVLMSLLVSCSALVGGLGAAFITTTYMTSEDNIRDASAYYTELETDLQIKLNKEIKKANSDDGYDEVRYEIDPFTHDPEVLIAYLSSQFPGWDFEFDLISWGVSWITDLDYRTIKGVEKSLFEKQYTYEIETIKEKHYSSPHQIIPEIWKVRVITLKNNNLETIVNGMMDDDTKEYYNSLKEYRGNRVWFDSPVKYDWKSVVASLYGFRPEKTSRFISVGSGSTNDFVAVSSAKNGETVTLPSGLGRYFTYMGWQMITSPSSQQYKLRQTAGQNFDNEGFGIINGRYVVATTTTYGNVGDYIDVYQSDGTVLQCIIGDIKNQNDAGCNKWGHQNGQVVVEFVVDKTIWYNNGHANPGTSSCHPEWGGKTIVQIANVGSYSKGSVSSSSGDSMQSVVYTPMTTVTNLVTDKEEHNGIDIAGTATTEVFSPIDGQVTAINNDSKYGNYVKIENDEYKFILASINQITVANGSMIEAGTKVGLMSDGEHIGVSHVHITIYEKGILGESYYNPYFYLDVGTEQPPLIAVSGLGSTGELVPGTSETGNKVASLALTRVGYMYLWGGGHSEATVRDPNTTRLDCSGLVNWAYCQAGAYIGIHNTKSLATLGVPVSYGEMQTGDVILWSSNGSLSGVHHAAIYIGNGQMVEAPSTGNPVRTGAVYDKNLIYTIRRLYND